MSSGRSGLLEVSGLLGVMNGGAGKFDVTCWLSLLIESYDL